jgi:hypothetical protein
MKKLALVNIFVPVLQFYSGIPEESVAGPSTNPGNGCVSD